MELATPLKNARTREVPHPDLVPRAMESAVSVSTISKKRGWCSKSNLLHFISAWQSPWAVAQPRLKTWPTLKALAAPPLELVMPRFANAKKTSASSGWTLWPLWLLAPTLWPLAWPRLLLAPLFLLARPHMTMEGVWLIPSQSQPLDPVVCLIFAEPTLATTVSCFINIIQGVLSSSVF